ncbi:multidrug resistance protein 4 [Infundibulicybe gibba]|nr:multidrug resistance protein 4 [Infundibulicybe gibba]
MTDVDSLWNDSLQNPRNWSWGKKWASAGIVSFYTFVSPLASSMMAPGLLQVADEYHITNETITALTLSIFLLAYAVGPLIMAPLSETFGRRWVLHISNLVFLLFNVACAFAPTVDFLLLFRFLAGLAGSTPISCGGGSISDMFSEKDRASAMSIYTLGPLLGPVIGPVLGGWVAQTIGPKWVFIVIAGLCSAASAIGIPFLHETYAPVIRAHLERKISDSEHGSSPYQDPPPPTHSQQLLSNVTRPILLLTRSFICFMLSLYMAFVYAIYYLLFATFANFFKVTYGFGPGDGGLCYLGLGSGFFLATLFGAKFADRIYAALSARNGGVGKPEMRIPALIFGSLFAPIGVLWYGWSAQMKLHWIMPIIGSGIFGFGLMTTSLPIQLYLVDSFKYAASALGAASVFRSLLGFAFPLFGQQMYDTLGLGGGNTLLAGLGILFGIPFPIWLYYHGEKMRARSHFVM